MAAETIPAYIAWSESPRELAARIKGLSSDAFADALDAIARYKGGYLLPEVAAWM
jgi:hypothetical protein